MKFTGFEIQAEVYITRSFCECGEELKEVSDGWLSSALFCPKCENVYQIKRIKVPKSKITKKYLEQCRKEISK